MRLVNQLESGTSSIVLTLPRARVRRLAPGGHEQVVARTRRTARCSSGLAPAASAALRLARNRIVVVELRPARRHGRDGGSPTSRTTIRIGRRMRIDGFLRTAWDAAKYEHEAFVALRQLDPQRRRGRSVEAEADPEVGLQIVRDPDRSSAGATLPAS